MALKPRQAGGNFITTKTLESTSERLHKRIDELESHVVRRDRNIDELEKAVGHILFRLDDLEQH